MIAFTREVSTSIDRCELTHLHRQPIDLDRARRQHRAFEAALTAQGCEVHRLPDAPNLPDAVFVQDVAIVFDEVAVVARPGAESRRPEAESVARALAAHRPLRWIEPPGTLEGGDIVCIGRDVYVGRTQRTNAAAIQQLGTILRRLAYTVHEVSVTGCLHLQTAATPVADHVLLVNRQWIDPTVFGQVEVIDVEADEPFGANAFRVGDEVIYPAAFPRTSDRLAARGIRVVTVDVSELAKAEAGVTCCCILV